MPSSAKFLSYLESSASLLQKLIDQPALATQVSTAIEQVVSAVLSGKPILTCGNGGSASDALHVSGELVGRFFQDRQALNVICLNSNVTVMTAWANDVSYESVFSRQVEAHGSKGGVLWGFSTSGNSKNVVDAFRTAKEIGMTTIVMTGSDPGMLGGLADHVISVPGTDAPSAQNLHVVVYHFMCAEIEKFASVI